MKASTLLSQIARLPAMVMEISVGELRDMMEQGNKPFLLDIREPHEREICKLDDDAHIPMSQVPQRVEELSEQQEIIVYCRSGQRSYQVTHFLMNQGFQNVKNLAGGILAWSDEVDPSVQKY